MDTHFVTRQTYGETFTFKLQAICGDAVKAGTFQIVGDDARLDGFVLPNGAAVESYDLGNVTFVRCADTEAHRQTLAHYRMPDWSHGECETASLATVEE